MESAARGFTRHRITVPHAGRCKGWTVDLIGGQVGGTVDAVKAGITTNAAKRLAELAEVGLTDVLALYEVPDDDDRVGTLCDAGHSHLEQDASLRIAQSELVGTEATWLAARDDDGG